MAADRDKVGESTQAPSAELTELRNRTLAQAKELAVMRWEIASLMRSHPMLGRVTEAKSFLKRRFPVQLDRAMRMRRAAGNLVRRLRRAPPAPATTGPETMRHPQRFSSPIIIADRSAVAERLAAIVGSGGAIRLLPGAGFPNSLPLATEGEPPLRGPAAGSLAEWLVSEGSNLRNVGTVAVDAGDEISLALLRGRMHVGQTLVLSHASGVKAPCVDGLGEPTRREQELAFFSRLPDDWLDPLDPSGTPNSELIGKRRWPKISVVMVSFNQAAFLEEGLRSVLNQNYPNLEFLVVDGQSKDGSIDILERYRPRLDFLLVEPDRGQADGLNKGFARATGDILTWVNSDDLLEPGALFRVAQAFTQMNVDMVVGGCLQIGLTRAEIIRRHHTKLPFAIPVPLPLGLLLELDRFWLTACFFYQPEVFFSHDIWQRSGGRLRADLNFVLDYDLWVRMAAAGATIFHIPDFLACSRTHEQQKTTVGMPYLPEVQRLLRDYAGRLALPPA
jgi:hypothetical protein